MNYSNGFTSAVTDVTEIIHKSAANKKYTGERSSSNNQNQSSSDTPEKTQGAVGAMATAAFSKASNLFKRKDATDQDSAPKSSFASKFSFGKKKDKSSASAEEDTSEKGSSSIKSKFSWNRQKDHQSQKIDVEKVLTAFIKLSTYDEIINKENKCDEKTLLGRKYKFVSDFVKVLNSNKGQQITQNAGNDLPSNSAVDISTAEEKKPNAPSVEDKKTNAPSVEDKKPELDDGFKTEEQRACFNSIVKTAKFIRDDKNKESILGTLKLKQGENDGDKLICIKDFCEHIDNNREKLKNSIIGEALKNQKIEESKDTEKTGNNPFMKEVRKKLDELYESWKPNSDDDSLKKCKGKISIKKPIWYTDIVIKEFEKYINANVATLENLQDKEKPDVGSINIIKHVYENIKNDISDENNVDCINSFKTHLENIDKHELLKQMIDKLEKAYKTWKESSIENQNDNDDDESKKPKKQKKTECKSLLGTKPDWFKSLLIHCKNFILDEKTPNTTTESDCLNEMQNKSEGQQCALKFLDHFKNTFLEKQKPKHEEKGDANQKTQPKEPDQEGGSQAIRIRYNEKQYPLYYMPGSLEPYIIVHGTKLTFTEMLRNSVYSKMD